MLPEWQTGIVRQIIQATPNTRRFRIELPGVASFPFTAGQFVTLDLPIHENRNRRWRSYSIASPPDGSNIIELIVVQATPSTGGSDYLFQKIKTGSELTLRGPHGMFVLPKEWNEPLYLIATGTGIAPFRSILLDFKEKNILPPQPVHLIFGCRQKCDLLYNDEMQQLARELDWFSYHPTLSREKWEGHCGYVHAVYEALCQGSPGRFMVCGWRAMIEEAKERLLKMGYDRKVVHYELYG